MNDELNADWLGEKIPLYPDDTLEDLQRGGFRLLQKQQGFRFGLDSVLLAAYTASFYEKNLSRPLLAADLGAGCGAVSLLLAARMPALNLTGLEIEPVSYEAFCRNVRLNKVENRMAAVLGDIRQLAAGCWSDLGLPAGRFDLVVSNPPYEQHQPSRRQVPAILDSSRRRAREETDLDLDSLIHAAARLLRSGGRLVLVHQVRRLPDILCALRDHGLEAKTMRLIQSLPDRPAVTFLLSAIRQGRPGGFAAAPILLVCSSPGILSNETSSLYGLEPQLPPETLLRGLYRAEKKGDANHDGQAD